jgi:hypothetical protein
LTVEQCLSLTVESFYRDRAGNCTSGRVGTATWTDPQGSPLGKIEYAVQNDADVLAVHIRRQYARLCGDLRPLEECLIPITTTPAHLGGERRWFSCPTMRDGNPCGRRVGRLYLPPGAAVFGCRQCYNLTYSKSQKHDKGTDALRREFRAQAMRLVLRRQRQMNRMLDSLDLGDGSL